MCLNGWQLLRLKHVHLITQYILLYVLGTRYLSNHHPTPTTPAYPVPPSPPGSCAFRNTPKFSAVRGRGKIVRGEWLTECTKQKRRLGWRRFATDPADGRQPESGDELWAEELRPKPPPARTGETGGGKV